MNGCIQLLNLSTGYGAAPEACVTRKFSCVIAKGTLTCVLGTNGTGKSTLLRTIAGFQKPASGEVRVLGRNVAEYSRKELARTLGVVLTERQVFNTQMDVEELVSLGRIPYTGFFGKLGDADRRAIDAALSATGMTALRTRAISTLSDGERQKAMIAKTLAQQTPVILLDEPTAFLDFPSKAETFRLLRRLAKNAGKTVVAATHDLGAAFQTADNLLVLQRGKTPVSGTPTELAQNGALDIFFESAGVSFDRKNLNYSILPEN